MLSVSKWRRILRGKTETKSAPKTIFSGNDNGLKNFTLLSTHILKNASLWRLLLFFILLPNLRYSYRLCAQNSLWRPAVFRIPLWRPFVFSFFLCPRSPQGTHKVPNMRAREQKNVHTVYVKQDCVWVCGDWGGGRGKGGRQLKYFCVENGGALHFVWKVQ